MKFLINSTGQQRIKHTSLLLAFSLAILSVAAQAKTTNSNINIMDRIEVKDGKFVNSISGEEFIPYGFNYARLRPHQEDSNVLWHDNFNPNRYDVDTVETMLSELQTDGFNIVRVFIDHTGSEYGGILNKDGSLSEQYVSNFVDFIERASNHNIYVIPTGTYTPNGGKYLEEMESGETGLSEDDILKIEDANINLFFQNRVNAHAMFCADLIEAVKTHNPDLLNTIFSFDLENELTLIAEANPFNLTEGTFTYKDKSYNLSSDEEKQKLADDATTNWFETHASQIKKIAPDLMLTVSVFTYKAVGRTGPAKFSTDTSTDKRMPANLIALAKAPSIDYLDMHMYMLGIENDSISQYFYDDLKSVKWDELKQLCDENGIPIVVGEYGAFIHIMKNTETASKYIREHLDLMKEIDIKGSLYWTYDNQKQRETIMDAKYDNGMIYEELCNY